MVRGYVFCVFNPKRNVDPPSISDIGNYTVRTMRKSVTRKEGIGHAARDHDIHPVFGTTFPGYFDRKFRERHAAFTGFTAQIIQHEVDHCAGIII